MIDTAGAKELLTSNDVAKLQKHAEEYSLEYNEMEESASQDTLTQVLKLLLLIYNRILQLQTANGASDVEKAETLTHSGTVWNWMGQYDRALEQLTKALSMSPGNSNTLQAIAKSYTHKSMYAEAIEAQEKVIDMASGDDKAVAYGRMAAIYESKADFVEEAAALRMACDTLVDTTSETAAGLYKQLGTTEEKLGNYDAAVIQLSKCLAILRTMYGKDDERIQNVEYLIEMAKQ